ncbi:hypothetical protein QC763_305370 [Podospora pseudopauciseta]|uniref:Uncharacterized protein n=2 Tax=Podospora TaxID=5144 RepID=A0ABR0HGP0_9PEZI|nr:hypothetical protein QC763_305370 [Podospora pseudopauciseta]KAK4678189.1 hypothetical protein QC764_305370 [Podospora pseudoanserina]
MSQPNKTPLKPRDPPPSLFLHPSAAPSHASLINTQPQPSSSHPPPPPGSSRPGSSLLRTPPEPFNSPGVTSIASLTSPATINTTAAAPGLGGLASPLQPGRNAGGLGITNLPLLPRQESTRATDRTDALWAEMQATLEEVELSASGGTRVFGPDHERKLDELRMAQIALAQAWARSEADEAIELAKPGETTAAATSAGGPGTQGEGANTEGGKSTVGTGSVPPGARPGSRRGGGMEEETDVDILLARKRREANDRYFQRVNQGVLDVVAKLEEVATAMRAVELESKEIWGDGEGESVAGSSKS